MSCIDHVYVWVGVDTDVPELVVGDSYLKERLRNRNNVKEDEEHSENYGTVQVEVLSPRTEMEPMVSYKDFMGNSEKYINILEPRETGGRGENENYMSMKLIGLNVKSRESDNIPLYSEKVGHEAPRKESLIKLENYLGEGRPPTDKVCGKGGEEEYNVPNPVYPTFTRSGVLTKSDIITMYCRER